MTPAALQTFRLSVLHSQYLETLPAGFGLELWQRSPESLLDRGRGWEGVPRGVILIIIIIVTRPKPAYGRQGLAGSLGQDTDQGCTFWGVLNVSLRAYDAQLGFKPTWNH